MDESSINSTARATGKARISQDKAKKQKQRDGRASACEGKFRHGKKKEMEYALTEDLNAGGEGWNPPFELAKLYTVGNQGVRWSDLVYLKWIVLSSFALLIAGMLEEIMGVALFCDSTSHLWS